MKKLIKESKKGGFRGHCGRWNLKMVALASFALLVVAALFVSTGDTGCVVAGLALAATPFAGFVVPDGIGLNDEEKKGLQALGEHFTRQFNDYVKGQATEEQVLEKMASKLESWAKESGLSKDAITDMQTKLKSQGELLTKLKEQDAATPNMQGLKAAFFKNYDSLKKAIKEKKDNFIVKAIDEHDPDLIHTTDDIVTTNSGATLEEMIGSNPNLILKRRDRQYIHDIANVSVVNEVPEVFNFYEEGDEDGNIAVVAENGLKPQVKLSLVKNQVEAQKAAGYIVVTEEVLKWRTRAWAAIIRLFRDKVYRDYENLLTTQLLTNASAYIGTALDGTIENPTDFDAIIAAILQEESINFQPNTLVINPADKWRLAMTTTENGMFVLPYIQNGGQFGLLGLRVITTNKVAPGSFLLGESGTWFIEEESPQIRTGLVNDDLLHNRMTIVGEIFFLSYVPSNNAGAWISGNFATIKEALATSVIPEP